MHVVHKRRQRQNKRHFADIFKCICSNYQIWIPIKASLNSIPKHLIDNKKHWFRKRIGTQQVTNYYGTRWWLKLLTHVYVTWPRWINNTCVRTFYVWMMWLTVLSSYCIMVYCFPAIIQLHLLQSAIGNNALQEIIFLKYFNARSCEQVPGPHLLTRMYFDK